MSENEHTPENTPAPKAPEQFQFQHLANYCYLKGYRDAIADIIKNPKTLPPVRKHLIRVKSGFNHDLEKLLAIIPKGFFKENEPGSSPLLAPMKLEKAELAP